MDTHDGINGHKIKQKLAPYLKFYGKTAQRIEQRLSEDSEVYGEALLGLHHDLKSLESKVESLSVLVVDDDKQTPGNSGLASRLQALQTKLKLVEKLAGEAKADYDRGISELQRDCKELVSRLDSTEAQIQQCRSTHEQPEEFRTLPNCLQEGIETRISEVRTDTTRLSQELGNLSQNIKDFVSRLERQGGDIGSVYSDQKHLEGRLAAAEQLVRSAVTHIDVLTAASEATNQDVELLKRGIRLVARVGAVVSILLFVLIGALPWIIKFMK